jgi:hexulose-6-phosphate isomerase
LNASRREFLKNSVFTAAAVSAGATNAKASAVAGETPSHPGSIKKGVVYNMLPEKLPVPDRFMLARDTGFEVVQAFTTPDQRDAEKIKKAAERAGIKLDSVMNVDHWPYPLSSADPAVVEKSLAGMRTSLRNAKYWGSDTVLLVPAVLNAATSYRDAWIRSQKNIRKLLPLAAELKIVIAIEEVWNKFLYSPLEMERYVHEFESPWVKVWFDVGNVLLYGYPQDWIRTLGKRIVKLHVKDFKLKDNTFEWVDLGDGDADWTEVRKALSDIGYSGSAIAEFKPRDEAYLRDLSRRMDQLILGKAQTTAYEY